MVRSAVLATALCGVLSACPAFAVPRAFISGKGVDTSTCGPVASPCRTPQYAHNLVDEGGEIDILDPAGYGAITITKSISIINDGVGIAGFLAPANGNAITINLANGGAVILRGLTIEGAGAGMYGVQLKTNATLTVSDCTIQGFNAIGGSGIVVDGAAYNPSITILNTVSSNNVGGIFIQRAVSGFSAANVVLDHVTTNFNTTGVTYDSDVPFGTITISNHVASNNVTGILLSGGLAQGYTTPDLRSSIKSSVISHNTTGVRVDGAGSTLYLGETTITSNGTGLSVASPGNPALTAVYSYGTNKIGGNTTDVSGTLSAVPRQ